MVLRYYANRSSTVMFLANTVTRKHYQPKTKWICIPIHAISSAMPATAQKCRYDYLKTMYKEWFIWGLKNKCLTVNQTAKET